MRGIPSEEYPQALGYLKYENAWYRKHFMLDEKDRDKRITLYFEGIATKATVYLNGCLLKHNYCGYTPFEVDITDYAFFDKENILAVYVDTSEHEGWWYEGGGIYRHVWLIKTSQIAVDLWGIYVNPQKQNESTWNVDIETTIINVSEKNDTVEIFSTIFDKNGVEIISASDLICVDSYNKNTLKQSVKVKNPMLWDIDMPDMYILITTVKRIVKKLTV